MPIQGIKNKSGLASLMERVVVECDRASVSFAPDPIHDLRVALRRCCSIADAVRTVDPDPAWREMKKAGKALFRKLGELRDLHVMQDWIHRLDTPGDPVTSGLLHFVSTGETRQQQEALQALQEFDRKQWQRWGRRLPQRMARLREGNPVFQHLALERWTDAYRLHRRTLRNPSLTGLHRLRIALKRFRYIVENFLPVQHSAWSEDLKHVQDLLGDVHDLDVLWALAARAGVFPDDEAQARWQKQIDQERIQRIHAYHERTTSEDSLWKTWRSELPRHKDVEGGGLLRLKLWASLLDPNFKHSMHVSRLALQLYDGLAAQQKPATNNSRDRTILGIASLLHDVGRSKNEKGHHKTAYRLIRRIEAPLGIRKQDLLIAGVVARYHRGALPGPKHRPLSTLTPAEKKTVVRLAAILRLAAAFDLPRDGHIRRLQVVRKDGFLIIAAQGYTPHDRGAVAIAAARHPLELIYRGPVMVKPLRVGKPKLLAEAQRKSHRSRRPLKSDSQRLAKAS